MNSGRQPARERVSGQVHPHDRSRPPPHRLQSQPDRRDGEQRHRQRRQSPCERTSVSPQSATSGSSSATSHSNRVERRARHDADSQPAGHRDPGRRRRAGGQRGPSATPYPPRRDRAHRPVDPAARRRRRLRATTARRHPRHRNRSAARGHPPDAGARRADVRPVVALVRRHRRRRVPEDSCPARSCSVRCSTSRAMAWCTPAPPSRSAACSWHSRQPTPATTPDTAVLLLGFRHVQRRPGGERPRPSRAPTVASGSMARAHYPRSSRSTTSPLLRRSPSGSCVERFPRIMWTDDLVVTARRGDAARRSRPHR